LLAAVQRPVGRLLAEGQADAAKPRSPTRGGFPEPPYVELMRHGTPEEADPSRGLGGSWPTPWTTALATNDVHSRITGFYEAHDALLALPRDGRRRRRPQRLTDHTIFDRRGDAGGFADLPEACDNTLVLPAGAPLSPAAPADPAGFPTAEGINEETALRRARSLARARLAAPGLQQEEAKPYRERLEFELGTIIRMGFAGYFLIVSDIIQWAKRQGIPVGPGAARERLGCRLGVDDHRSRPVAVRASVRAVLNPERVSMPDFRHRFCQDRRDEVIRYVQEKYGRDRVAQIITFGKLQARAVLRDVGRVLAMPYGQVDRLCKLVPNIRRTRSPSNRRSPASRRCSKQRNSDDSVARLITIALSSKSLPPRLDPCRRGGDRRPTVDRAGSALTATRAQTFRSRNSHMKWVELAGW